MTSHRTPQADPPQIRLFLEETALKCKITFVLLRDVDPNSVRYTVDFQDKEYRQLERRTHGFTSGYLRTTKWTTFDSRPGSIYHVIVTCHDNETSKILGIGRGRFRGVFSQNELAKLWLLALKESKLKIGRRKKITHLYRCKPAEYFNQCKNNLNGRMTPYRKDENGQGGNPINGRIDGLFFSAKTMLGPSGSCELPMQSPFGNTRFSVDARHILDPTKCLFYFCDFYCTVKSHYLTIVICHPGSKANRFCADRLLQMPADNPFLKITERGQGNYEYEVDQTFWVEFFYTEEVPSIGANWTLFRRKDTGRLWTEDSSTTRRVERVISIRPIPHYRQRPALMRSSFDLEMCFVVAKE
ncbi:hypothetical protein L596_012941 [Steinernema carpocapsae]|uniref:Phytanoyl-CoA hydroxylase-interacting protein-like C-terminal domain-containing protein n=1 Tax=Steinernema carpocapsae TaxID=34508 RepID=A0A4U5NZH7_STECR|nr:hypothetical protein L596_012941 [Steinernema carpocapsae]